MWDRCGFQGFFHLYPVGIAIEFIVSSVTFEQRQRGISRSFTVSARLPQRTASVWQPAGTTIDAELSSCCLLVNLRRRWLEVVQMVLDVNLASKPVRTKKGQESVELFGLDEVGAPLSLQRRS